MTIRKSSDSNTYDLLGIDADELNALKNMIGSCCIVDKRFFGKVLKQIEKFLKL